MKNINWCFLIMLLHLLPTQLSGKSLTSCESILKYEKSTVKYGAPYQVKLKPQVETVTISVDKTAGTAPVIVSIYLDGIEKESFSFPNSKVKKVQTKTFKNIRNKSFKVKIVNPAKDKSFSYHLTIKGHSSALGEKKIKLKSLGKETFYTATACGEKVKVELARKKGKAKATIYVYRGNIKVWESFWGGEEKRISKIFPASTNKKYKIVVKNVSADQTVELLVKALQL
ncbi:MAG: hypothetical protein AB8G15_17760 [Saprospiraceae bacterium]